LRPESEWRATVAMDGEQGIAKTNKHAEWRWREHAGAAASLREGLHETF